MSVCNATVLTPEDVIVFVIYKYWFHTFSHVTYMDIFISLWNYLSYQLLLSLLYVMICSLWLLNFPGNKVGKDVILVLTNASLNFSLNIIKLVYDAYFNTPRTHMCTCIVLYFVSVGSPYSCYYLFDVKLYVYLFL